MRSTSVFLISTIFSVNLVHFTVHGGGTSYSPCADHTKTIRGRSNQFLSSILTFQTSCIATLNNFIEDHPNLPKTNFTNELYDQYTQCVNNEGDLFKDYYNDLVSDLKGVSEVASSENVMSYLTGVVDVTQYPFICINEDLQTAVTIISVYDRDLNFAAQSQLRTFNSLVSSSSSGA